MASRKNFPGRLEARRQQAAERSALNNRRVEENTQETLQEKGHFLLQVKTTNKSAPVQRSLFRIIGGWALGIAIVLGLSYWSELPKYQFERMATETGRHIPGARLIGSMKTADFASPISWFWPATTTWNFATPDPLMRDRFYTLTLIYDEKESPIVFLVDADCEARKEVLYDLDQPESAFPARNLWGEPVVAPNGKTYRQLKTNIAPPPEWLHAYCDTDWTAERKAVAAAMRQ